MHLEIWAPESPRAFLRTYCGGGEGTVKVTGRVVAFALAHSSPTAAPTRESTPWMLGAWSRMLGAWQMGGREEGRRRRDEVWGGGESGAHLVVARHEGVTELVRC